MEQAQINGGLCEHRIELRWSHITSLLPCTSVAFWWNPRVPREAHDLWVPGLGPVRPWVFESLDLRVPTCTSGCFGLCSQKLGTSVTLSLHPQRSLKHLNPRLSGRGHPERDSMRVLQMGSRWQARHCFPGPYVSLGRFNGHRPQAPQPTHPPHVSKFVALICVTLLCNFSRTIGLQLMGI